jgi:hypothetical protein
MKRKVRSALLLVAFALALSIGEASSVIAQEAVLSDTLRHYILSGWVIVSFSSSGTGFAFLLQKGPRLKLCNVGTTTECYTLNF